MTTGHRCIEGSRRKEGKEKRQRIEEKLAKRSGKGEKKRERKREREREREREKEIFWRTPIT